MGKIRGTHSSPGIYTQMNDLSYSAKNIGVTTLGLVGETLQGPAFEPIKISDWSEFVNYFGETSPEKFKDSQYPKYELPYIAKSYLSASDQLYVCRVLGLSGYNAGPAFVITAEGSGNTKYVIAVLRSRADYDKYANINEDECNPDIQYDKLKFRCQKIEIGEYKPLVVNVNCTGVTTTASSTGSVSSIDHGRFTLKTYANVSDTAATNEYSVSLNYGAKDYIYNVLGGSSDGQADIFVEEFYDYYLSDLIESGNVTKISTGITAVKEVEIFPFASPVDDFLKVPSDKLSSKLNGKRFLYREKSFEGSTAETAETTYYYSCEDETGTNCTGHTFTEGMIYSVEKKFDTDSDSYKYVYVSEGKETDVVSVLTPSGNSMALTSVTVNSINNFVVSVNGSVEALSSKDDFSDYHEGYRCAVTPWIVSELKGDAKNIDIKKLFRFYTISDGNASNTQVKISIANIRPEEGTFDVYVRDFYDTDSNPIFLETYKGLSMRPGDSRYIAMKIGTVDGTYEIKSKYVALEIIENEYTRDCVPCGFLGYPVRHYQIGTGTTLVPPSFSYNRLYDITVKNKKQYFGLSDITGIDSDMLSYKGKLAYTDEYAGSGYTHSFHLDSSISDKVKSSLSGNGVAVTVTLDNDAKMSGITWDTVSPMNEGKAPVIGYEYQMEGTIYEDIKARKFTVCFYGGFDGWDVYRKSRTNGDEYTYSKYKGALSFGKGNAFSAIQNPETLALTGRCINSDYYAYLAGANQFEDRDKVEINLFATPGIDYVNQKSLTEDIIDMIENRLDTFYVVTTPDKPFGASDAEEEMFSSREVAENLEDSEISTYLASTYYPWVKYEDKDNHIYVNLPATKDVLRNMANTDNKRYPWIAPAGLERGTVNCVNLHTFTKLEDRDNVYDERINALMKFSRDGVKIWGNKTMYECDETNPFNRINCVRLMLYMRKLIIDATNCLIFEPNDTTLKEEFESIVKPILLSIKADRGITDFRLDISQTKEEMDARKLSCRLWVKPTPTLEYIEIEFMVTPQGIDFDVKA